MGKVLVKNEENKIKAEIGKATRERNGRLQSPQTLGKGLFSFKRENKSEKFDQRSGK